MHVRLSDNAEGNLDYIHRHIAKDNPDAATRIVDTILAALFQLESFPFLGRHGRVAGTRELTVPGTSYYVVYTLPDDYHIDIELIRTTASSTGQNPILSHGLRARPPFAMSPLSATRDSSGKPEYPHG